ncbi:uncharacterized protein LOC108228561 isoform X4 [Kryptolebias marmoratus]|nr:uncharacterized protein LOC108228561 isoform X3 [Kryptolebias marmoratus]XP_037830300.1 uncharacterized protein LOC108228561 isoform X4 [Kryptolebias marmoratus]
MLLSCWESVNSQDSAIEGYLGEDITLPCIYSKPLPNVFNVHWTDTRNDLTLLDIKNNNSDVKSQDEKYKGRVESFQESFKDGNFSIILKKLRQDDADTYECTIPEVFLKKKVTLKVSDQLNDNRGLGELVSVSSSPCERGKRVQSTTPSTPPSGGTAGANVLPVALLSALTLLLCFRRHM